MGKLLAQVGENLELWEVELDEIREQEVNANTMPPEMFDRLVTNIKKEGRLESLPFTCKREGYFELISGHHRTRAARSAELGKIRILADTRNLSRDQVIAKQLAHNSIDGKDDMETLKQLYGEMNDIDSILESYIDPNELFADGEKVPYDMSNVAVDLPWATINLTFLPEHLEKFESLIKNINPDSQLVGVVDKELFQRFREAVIEVGKIDNIKMTGAVVARMIEIAELYIRENQPEDEENGA